ncbi:MAG TPA: hypothetical protein VN519_04305 [Bryobacteraceae bacterium]|nr:hypothetical protein [Bryobacteraceae bacterium]
MCGTTKSICWRAAAIRTIRANAIWNQRSGACARRLSRGAVDPFGQSVTAGAARELDLRRSAVNVSRGMRGTLEAWVAEFREACVGPVFEELMRITALDQQLVTGGQGGSEAAVWGNRGGRIPASLQPAEASVPAAGPVCPKKGLRTVFDTAFICIGIRICGHRSAITWRMGGGGRHESAGAFSRRGLTRRVRILYLVATRNGRRILLERNWSPLAPCLRCQHFVNGGEIEIQNARIRLAVREDADGNASWTAEPQQLPFLRAVGIDQMRANSR